MIGCRFLRRKKKQAFVFCRIIFSESRKINLSIAEAEAKKNDVEISGPVVSCVADLAFKYAAHRNDNLVVSLRSLCNELKAKEPQSERKRKKGSCRKEDRASTSNVVLINDL